MQKDLQILSVAETLFILALCISCTSRQAISTYVRHRVDYLKEQTAPPDAFVKETRERALNGQMASARWEFDTAQSRSDYLRWVTLRLQSSYRQTTSGDSQLVFVVHSGGDSESITIETDPAKEKLHVQITFVTYPD